jgi:serine/threonine-protein kinase RsbT
MWNEEWIYSGRLWTGEVAEPVPEVEGKLDIRSSEDVVRVRQAVRALAMKVGLNLVDQTKIVTAASELARNTLDYAGGGAVTLESVRNGTRPGVRLVFEDQGPGIQDVELAMKDGWTSGGGLGLGLSGAKRLSNEFEIHSRLGEGTRVTITRWKA